jgi:predicted metal-dependent hydrolase
MIGSSRKSAARAAETLYLDVTYAGDTHRVTLKRVPSARRYTLRVRAATRDVVLTMPARGSLSGARAFVERQAGWIAARLSRLPAPQPFAAGALVPVRGTMHQIIHLPAGRRPAWLQAEAEGLPCLYVTGDAVHLPRRVRDFLIREARRDLEEAVLRHAAAVGIAARKLTLRDTTSRWGSCSAVRALSFSWRLIMAPPHVLDYLAAHECAHLRHMDHSKDFWALTHALTPEVDRAEAWLKAHGSTLLRYGTARGTPLAELSVG